MQQKIFVDRNLAGKNYFESFRSIQDHCQKMNKISFQPDYDSKYIVTKLRNDFDSKVNESLANLLRAFGQNRKPHPLETLVFFTASLLSGHFSKLITMLKSIDSNESLVSDFRVGTEI